MDLKCNVVKHILEPVLKSGILQKAGYVYQNAYLAYKSHTVSTVMYF